MPRPKRSDNPIAQDAYGTSYYVKEVRPTRHGFDLLIGWPITHVTHRVGKRTILTAPLIAYMETRRYPVRGADLPIGATTIKSLRRSLGLDWHADHAAWWEERIIDLMDLSAADFAARHGQKLHTVEVARIRLLGTRQPQAGWWRSPDVAAEVLSDLPRGVVAMSLGLSVGAIGRMRWALRKEAGEIG